MRVGDVRVWSGAAALALVVGTAAVVLTGGARPAPAPGGSAVGPAEVDLLGASGVLPQVDALSAELLATALDTGEVAPQDAAAALAAVPAVVLDA